MIVKCINDDWSSLPNNSVAKLVLKVGDPMPEHGKEYEVIGYASLNNGEGYELAGLDYSNYPGGRIIFKKERFVIVDDTFVPNTVHNGYPAREFNFYGSFTYKIKGRIPRKEKKRRKKVSGVYFVHPDHKLVNP